MTIFVSGWRWECTASCCFQVFLFLLPGAAHYRAGPICPSAPFSPPPSPPPTVLHIPAAQPLTTTSPGGPGSYGVFLSGGVAWFVGAWPPALRGNCIARGAGLLQRGFPVWRCLAGCRGMAPFLASQGFRPPSRASAPRSSAWLAALPGGARPPGRLVFPACAPCGYFPPPATARRTILLQRFSFDSGSAYEQPAPTDLQRHPGDEFCHPAPGPWTRIAGPTPKGQCTTATHRPGRAPRTWCARRTLRTNNRLRVFVKGASCAPLATTRAGCVGAKNFSPLQRGRTLWATMYTEPQETSPLLVPTLQRGNAAPAAPASGVAGGRQRPCPCCHRGHGPLLPTSTAAVVGAGHARDKKGISMTWSGILPRREPMRLVRNGWHRGGRCPAKRWCARRTLRKNNRFCACSRVGCAVRTMPLQLNTCSLSAFPQPTSWGGACPRPYRGPGKSFLEKHRND